MTPSGLTQAEVDALYDGVDLVGLVGIAGIDPARREHVTHLLHRHRIANLVEGSVVYGVAVPPGQEQRALAVLREDVAQHGYWVQYSRDVSEPGED